MSTAKRTAEQNHNKPRRRRIPRTMLRQPNLLSRIPPLHLPLPLPPHSTTTHPLPPHPISPLDRAHSHGQTRNTTNTTMAHTPWLVPLRNGDPDLGQTKDATNTTTAHAPRLVLLQNDDPPLGQSYPPPLRFFLSEILAPRLGQTYATVDADNTPPSPTYVLHVHHPGLSYPTTSIQPHRTAETPNGESRLNPGIFRTKFLFDFISTHLLSLT
jgi:hypothetical protein